MVGDAPRFGGDSWRVAGLLLAVFALHIPSLWCPLFLDDYVYLYDVRQVSWPWVGALFTSPALTHTASSMWFAPAGVLPFYRPLGVLLFAFDHAVWGLAPFGYHLTNLLLHLLATWLTYRLARRLFNTDRPALLTAAVFAVHPVHGEALYWVSGRFDLLVCCMVLLTILSYDRWMTTPGRRGLRGVITVLLFLSALACKETALTLPGVMLLLEGTRWRTGGRPARTRAVVRLTCLFACAAAYLAGRMVLFGGLGSMPPPYGLDTSSLLVAVRQLTTNITQYLLDFIFCVQIDATACGERLLAHPGWTLGLLALSLFVLGLTARIAWRDPVFRIGVIWLALFTAPSLMAMAGERNGYLAGAGWALMLVAVYRSLSDRWRARPHMKRRLRAASITLLVFWSAITLVEQGVAWCLTRAGEQSLRQIQALAPAPPAGSHFYVVNMSPLNSVGFRQAIRLRYGREDLEGWGLTISPSLAGDAPDDVCVQDSNTLRIHRPAQAAFFEPFCDRFHRYGAPASTLPAAAERAGMTLMDPPASYEDLHTLTLRMPLDVNDPRLHVFQWDNRDVRPAWLLPDLVVRAGMRRRPRVPCREGCD
ncbi:hypothetical protein L21SP4_00356 [Kiritimatiella glycovorans]|uniref:Glycosyltransferase RgtA/B/C/D-like domain-containing protein n=2 Tax=Kiritimatiella glycovorans TaxID=1307763 RepID=A0A0G3EDZ4_9BACT|nr:hypothetical protein L21SP4_00356 [Kiritimatiella glycovorans]